jgi:LysM repeat protein
MNKLIYLLLLLLPVMAIAQPGNKDITHTVGAKESLTSIGRMYNINGRELANYNNIDYEKGLSIGQVLKIPAKYAGTTNTKPATAPAPTAASKPVAAETKTNTPVYHTVEKKQTLYAVSKMYNTSVAEIKKWNNLTTDGLSEGVKLIVGYTTGTAATTPAVEETKPAEPALVVVAKNIEPVKEKAPAPVVVVTPPPTEEKKPEPIKTATPTPVAKTETAPVNFGKAADFKGGVFKTDFDAQTPGRTPVNENGAGGIFKSTSGWSDGKYYCLHNTALPGTIIKITNSSNGKSIYAKVLDLIPDIKQNVGLIIRLSNAAADALGAGDTKIDCTLNYSK